MPRAARPPSVLGCMLLLAAVRIRLKATGFGKSLAWARKRAAARTAAPPPPQAAAALVEQAVRTLAYAAALFPGRAICLEQGLTLMMLLRRRGIVAELRVGVQPFPFNAHAWVEVDGVAVGENPDLVDYLVPFPTGAI